MKQQAEQGVRRRRTQPPPQTEQPRKQRKRRLRIHPLGILLLLLFAGSLGVLAVGGYQLMGVEQRMTDGAAEARSVIQLGLAETAQSGGLTAGGAIHAAVKGEPIGLLTFPDSRATEVAIYDGTDDAALERGAGHATDTALPGEPGNCVLFGHRDSAFRPMEQVEQGDTLLVETASGATRYTVHTMFVTTPEDAAFYEETEETRLTLVTCYPFRFVGPAPERYVIIAMAEDENRPVLLQ